MIDTIHIFLPSDNIPNNYLITTNSNYIDTNKNINIYTGEINFFGNFKNFKIRQNQRGIYLKGSLAKYYLGDNQKTLRSNDIPDAFIQLSNDLGLSINDAIVTRIDIAENIITNQPVSAYYKILGTTRYFRRLELNQGLNFQNGNRVLCFYDKNKETQRKNKSKNKTAVSPVFNNRNVLRYEHRFLNHNTLAEYLKLTSVTVNDVILFYPDLVKSWAKDFMAIYKAHDTVTFNEDVFKIKGEFDRQIKILGVQAVGGLQAVLKKIDQAKEAKAFSKYDNQASNLANRYKKLMQSPNLTQISNLVEELNNKVKIVAAVSMFPYYQLVN